jgi:hypothetical protein
VTEEAVDPELCEVGKDLFVAWRVRPVESESCWSYDDVEVISEAGYEERARSVDSGQAPA